MYSLEEVEESKKIIFSLSKIIDSFIMFHYLSKELQEESNTDKLVKIFFTKVVLESTFNMSDVSVYIEEGLGFPAKQLILENDKIVYKVLDNTFQDLTLKFNQDTQSGDLCVFGSLNGKKVAVCFKTNSLEIEPETLKILEIYTFLFISKLENSLLQENIKNQYEELQIKNKELLELQASLVQKEKLASIGQLSAGVAHELNNPIGFISGNFSALKEYVKIIKKFLHMTSSCMKSEEHSLEKIQEIIDYSNDNQLDYILDDLDSLFLESEDGLARVTNIIKSLKDFSRIDANGQLEDYSINQGIESTLTILKNEYKTVANVELNLEANIPSVKVIGGEINEVLLNIIVNAIQAIQNKHKHSMGTLGIKTYFDKDWIYCKIKDNGSGIPEEIINKIFDPFFTTKPIGKGTGLGLNISYNIIEKKHKGKLTVKSNLGEYTEFEIKLPRI